MSRETTRSYDALVTTRNEDEIKEAFGDFGVVKTEPTTEPAKRKALQVIHAGLTKLVFNRRAVEEALADGREITLARGYEVGKGTPGTIDGKRWWFKITPPIDLNKAVPWARPPQSQVMQKTVGLFSRENSKMACPSFALPAGAMEIGGTCPGAGAAQTVVPEAQRLAHAERVGEPVNVANTICSNCYASVGTSFQHGTVQLQEVTRYWWIHSVLKEQNGEEKLAQALIAGLEGEIAAGWDVERHGGRDYRFFRLHDSGDFFSTGYARAWIAVARALPEIRFWAPTRTWATPAFRKFWENADVPENLIVRPSAYHFNDASPYFDGMAAGTTSLYAVEDEAGNKVEQLVPSKAQWNCQVYRADAGEHSCIDAVRPSGPDNARPFRRDEADELSEEIRAAEKTYTKVTKAGKTVPDEDHPVIVALVAKRRKITGCRACWLFSDMTVNYTAHLLWIATLFGLFA